jgi:NADPH-dependent 2,4-dienoyl-CoA reductase/sulfur reductase-like enzyme
VVFHLGRTVKAVCGVEKVREVALDDKTVIEAQLVLAGLGVVPAVGWLEESGLVKDGAIPVDATLKTSADDVYAAGDIAVVPDQRTGEAFRIEHWVVAERLGQHAGRAMLGSEDAYGEVPFFWTMQGKVSLKCVGFARQFDSIAFRGEVEKGDFLAGYYRDGRLLAVAAARRSEEAILASEILKAGVEVPFEEFEDASVDLADYLAD